MPSRVRREQSVGQGARASRVSMSEADMATFYREVFLPLVRRGYLETRPF